MALTDVSGRLLRVNEALCRITGYDIGEITSRLFLELSDRRDALIDATQRKLLLAGSISTYQVEKRLEHARGHPVWVLLSVSLVRDRDGVPLRLINQIQDISERKVAERRLEHLVDHDFLTGLHNSRRFEQMLALELGLAARYGDVGALMLVDLDHFKAVNDEFGHQAGDELLKTVAAALRGRVRATDTLARLGGDEFGVILTRVDAEQARVAAEGIVQAVRLHPTVVSGREIRVTASVGVVPLCGLDIRKAMATADLAMYQAKAEGRNRHSFVQPQMEQPPRRQSQPPLAERIEQALSRD